MCQLALLYSILKFNIFKMFSGMMSLDPEEIILEKLTA